MQNISELSKKDLGDLGEDVAVRFLKNKGYLIKYIKYKLGRGEIDIIALDKKNCLCFIEVKTKRADDGFNPLLSITDNKQRQLSKLALMYMQKFKIQNIDARFDVVTVVFKNDKKKYYDVNLFKNAFPLHSKYL